MSSEVVAAAREMADELYRLGDPEDARISDAFLRFADKIDSGPALGGGELRLRRMLDDMRWAIEAHPGTKLCGVDVSCVDRYVEGMGR